MRDWAQLVVTVLLVTLQGCATLNLGSDGQDDLPNFRMVDEHLYRGGQPTVQGTYRLAKLGVKTVVSLRAEDKEQQQHEQRLVESLGMRWVHLPMRPYWRPSDEQVRAFLDVALNPDQQPVFVHCHAGKNRAGTLVALYRIIAQGWSPKQAYAEAVSLGLVRWNVIPRYLILSEAQREYLPHMALARDGTGAWQVHGVVPVGVFASHIASAEGVVVDAQGNLYVTSERRAGAILRITPAGERSILIRGLGRPDDLVMDAAGNLYVSEEMPGGHIYRVTQDGRQSIAASSLRNPDGLAFDASGHLYVAEDEPDGRIVRIGLDGAQTWVDQLDRPEGIAFDEEGNLYISETAKHQLTRIRPSGERDVLVAPPFLREPDGLAYCAPYRGLFVTEDQPRGRLSYVTLTGYVITLAENLQRPNGITCDADGNLYVAERGRGRILKLFAEHLTQVIKSHSAMTLDTLSHWLARPHLASAIARSSSSS